jgi:hypothetical protein
VVSLVRIYRKCNFFLIFSRCISYDSVSLQVPLPLRLNRSPASNFGPKTSYRAEIVSVFPHLLQANARMVHQIAPQRLTFTFMLIPLHRSVCHFEPCYLRYDNDGNKS